MLESSDEKKKKKEHALPQRHNLVSHFFDTSLGAEDTSCLEADKLVQGEAEG